MDRYIYDEQERLIEWGTRIIGFPLMADVKAIGLERDGALVASVLFDTFSRCDCAIHIASNGTGHWLTRELLIRAFSYPFIQLGLRRVSGLVPSRNAAAIRFDLHLGFRYEGVARHALPDDDLVLLGMLREECRFIPAQYRS